MAANATESEGGHGEGDVGTAIVLWVFATLMIGALLKQLLSKFVVPYTSL